MDEIRERAVLAFDELNILKTRLIEGGLPPREARERFEDALLDAYAEGFTAAAWMLGLLGDAVFGPDGEEAAQTLRQSYQGEDIRTKFDRYYEAGDAAGLSDLLDSEYNRSYNKGGYDLAQKAEKAGIATEKGWDATLDNATRDSHFFLHGTWIPANERFYSISGDSALYPGGFETARENANCRCRLIWRRANAN